MIRINTELRKLTLKGGCVNVNVLEDGRSVCGSYQKLFVSDGSLKDVIESKEKPKMQCENCPYKSPRCTDQLDVYINKSAYTCVILETHMQIANGDWIATRHVIFGRYKGQKMIDVRKEYNKKNTN